MKQNNSNLKWLDVLLENCESVGVSRFIITRYIKMIKDKGEVK